MNEMSSRACRRTPTHLPPVNVEVSIPSLLSFEGNNQSRSGNISAIVASFVEHIIYMRNLLPCQVSELKRFRDNLKNTMSLNENERMQVDDTNRDGDIARPSYNDENHLNHLTQNVPQDPIDALAAGRAMRQERRMQKSSAMKQTQGNRKRESSWFTQNRKRTSQLRHINTFLSQLDECYDGITEAIKQMKDEDGVNDDNYDNDATRSLSFTFVVMLGASIVSPREVYYIHFHLPRPMLHPSSLSISTSSSSMNATASSSSSSSSTHPPSSSSTTTNVPSLQPSFPSMPSAHSNSISSLLPPPPPPPPLSTTTTTTRPAPPLNPMSSIPSTLAHTNKQKNDFTDNTRNARATDALKRQLLRCLLSQYWSSSLSPSNKLPPCSIFVGMLVEDEEKVQGEEKAPGEMDEGMEGGMGGGRDGGKMQEREDEEEDIMIVKEGTDDKEDGTRSRHTKCQKKMHSLLREPPPPPFILRQDLVIRDKKIPIKIKNALRYKMKIKMKYNTENENKNENERGNDNENEDKDEGEDEGEDEDKRSDAIDCGGHLHVHIGTPSSSSLSSPSFSSSWLMLKKGIKVIRIKDMNTM